MNEHLIYLYNWFSDTNCYPQFPNLQFPQEVIFTVKRNESIKSGYIPN